MPASGPPFAHTAQDCLALPELSNLVNPGSGPRRIGPHAEPSAVSVLVCSLPPGAGERESPLLLLPVLHLQL